MADQLYFWYIWSGDRGLPRTHTVDTVTAKVQSTMYNGERDEVTESMSTSDLLNAHAHMLEHMNTYMFTCIVNQNTYVCIYVYVHIHIYAYVYMYICICLYVHIHMEMDAWASLPYYEKARGRCAEQVVSLYSNTDSMTVIWYSDPTLITNPVKQACTKTVTIFEFNHA